MSKLHRIARSANDDLRLRVHFCQRTGQTWLHASAVQDESLPWR